MKNKLILSPFLIGLILLSTYTTIAIAELTINDPVIYLLKNEPVDQVNKSKTFTIGLDSKLREIPRDYSSLTKEIMGTKTLEEKINIEPILKRIIETNFQPSSEILRIGTTGNIYKVPPDVGETVLVKLYIPNEPTENLYHKLETLGASVESTL